MRFTLIKTFFTFIFLLKVSTGFAACLSTEIDSLRATALTSYKAHNTQSAEQLLSQYYDKQCDFYDMSQGSNKELNNGLWLISDLMFYRQKLGEQLNCLTLYDEVYYTWMVSDEGRYENKVDAALKANQKQCQSTIEHLYAVGETCPIVGYEKMLAIPDNWKNQNELYYEIACLGVVENKGNQRGVDRDGPKISSEGLGDLFKLEILYVEHVTKENGEYWDWEKDKKGLTWDEFNAQGWLSSYKINEVYFVSEEMNLFRSGYCFNLTPKFGEKVGI